MGILIRFFLLVRDYVSDAADDFQQRVKISTIESLLLRNPLRNTRNGEIIAVSAREIDCFIAAMNLVLNNPQNNQHRPRRRVGWLTRRLLERYNPENADLIFKLTEGIVKALEIPNMCETLSVNLGIPARTLKLARNNPSILARLLNRISSQGERIINQNVTLEGNIEGLNNQNKAFITNLAKGMAQASRYHRWKLRYLLGIPNNLLDFSHNNPNLVAKGLLVPILISTTEGRDDLFNDIQNIQISEASETAIRQIRVLLRDLRARLSKEVENAEQMASDKIAAVQNKLAEGFTQLWNSITKTGGVLVDTISQTANNVAKSIPSTETVTQKVYSELPPTSWVVKEIYKLWESWKKPSNHPSEGEVRPLEKEDELNRK